MVDYYNAGPYNGSVFEVAALANNVTYDRPCCGQGAQSAAVRTLNLPSSPLSFTIVLSILLVGMTFSKL